MATGVNTLISLALILILLYSGCVFPMLFYYKQTVFQGKDLTLTMLLNPRTYVENPILGMQIFVILSIALFSWFLDGYLRQYLKISQIYAWSTLISAPLNMAMTILILYLSQRNLADMVNWNAAFIWVIGYAISVYGATLLIKG